MPKLYDDDGRIQHAGVVLGINGVVGHSHRFFDRLSAGYFGSAPTCARPCQRSRLHAWWSSVWHGTRSEVSTR